jgi:hypothetical protein
VAVADINGDGRPDVVVTNESAGTISVLLGNGDGTLQPLQSYTIGFNPSFIATGDFSGNGRVDVAVAGKSGQLAILLNDRNGSLKVPIVYPLSKTPTALAMGDFNNDGHNDLALANARFQTPAWPRAPSRRSLPQISTRTAESIWWLPNKARSLCQSCLGRVTEPLRPLRLIRWGTSLSPPWWRM